MSIAHISKTPVNICLPDGTYCSFCNETITAQTIYYYQDYDMKNLITKLDTNSISNRRCLQYQMYDDATASEGTASYPVIYLTKVDEYDTTNGFVSQPIYECISPSIFYIQDKGSAAITFWTNFTEVPSKDTVTGDYIYAIEKVLNLKYSDLENFKYSKGSLIRVLCSANIEFQELYRKVDTSSVSSPTTVPIIRDINILKYVSSDYPVLDFSISGSGGGNSRHAHINNSDCGFAFAVFHPGTGVPLGNPWKS